MGVSENIKKVIENHQKEIIDDIPIKDLLYDFRAKKILSSEEIEKLENIGIKKKLNNAFLEILLTRTDRDFYEFCKVLQNNSATSIKNFGKMLEDEARGKFFYVTNLKTLAVIIE